MQIKQQTNELIPVLQELANTYDFQKEMEQCIEIHNGFKLRLPFIGAFSTGKSTLLNALLGEKLLGVQVTPETCLPTEIHFAETESIRLMNKDGIVSELSRQELRDQQYPINESDEDHWVDIGLPSPILSDFKELVLVDMPGWESGIAEHSQAIDGYVHLSGAYCLVVSAEEGTLRQSIKQILTELKLLNKPVVLIITKCDKQRLEDIADIQKCITKSVTDILEKEPLQVVTVSARKKQIEGVAEAIAMVNQQSDIIYHNMVSKPLLAVLERIQGTLKILSNEENLSIEQVQLACDQIPQDLATLQDQLAEVYGQIDAIVPQCIEATKNNLKSALASQVSSLASAVRRGSNIENEIGSALRQSFLVAIEQDFKPKVTQRLKALQNLGDLAPSEISVSSDFQTSAPEIDSTVLSQVVTLVLTKLITLVPMLKPFSTVIFAVTSLLTSKVDKQMREEQEREEAKQYVLHTLIPKVISQAEPTIISSFNDMAEKIKTELDQETEKKAQDKQQALQQLQQELEQHKQADQRVKDKLTADCAQIESIKQQLSLETL